jgi:hypothetical protein
MEQAFLETSDRLEYPANARQVMYVARPKVQERCDGECWKNSSYFTQTLLPNFIRDNPDLTKDWDVVFDARGHLVEPHTGLQVDLGTLQVREYIATWKDGFERALPAVCLPADCPTRGPANRYRFALFIEKEGFGPQLERANIANRFDIPILSTKGMSVTAARTLVEQLSAAGVTILVFRDFDKSGFSIVYTLSHDTRRYQFKTRPNVINVGLRLPQVLALGLPTERVCYGTSSRPCRTDPRTLLRSRGATDEECDFLVRGTARYGWWGERVELNALACSPFISFVETQLAGHGVVKVIPPRETLEPAFRRAVEIALLNRRLTELTAAAHAEAEQFQIPKRLRQLVELRLGDDQGSSWDAAIGQIARESVDKCR